MNACNFFEASIMNTPIKFLLPDAYNTKQLITELSKVYTIKTERPVLKRMAIYDTFDWRLFNKSLVLTVFGKSILLRKLFKTDNIHGAVISHPPDF